MSSERDDEPRKTPAEWCALLGVHIVDPDGWRFDQHLQGTKARPWEDPITRAEFDARAVMSTQYHISTADVATLSWWHIGQEAALAYLTAGSEEAGYDAAGKVLATRRHYSHRPYADGRNPALFVGPGRKLVLLTPDADALFAWRIFIDDADDGSGKRQTGINCAVFRNEGHTRSSDLILAAEPFAWGKWPAETRLYTYVNPEKVRHKRDPGRCFLKAGWRRCGVTKGGLVILEKYAPALVAAQAEGAKATHEGERG